MEWLLELVLVVLLAATLFHALRLERALGVLKRDRAALEALVAGFNDSTRQAESGIERLRNAADGAGRQIARQAEAAGALKEDLLFLIERGEQVAERMDKAVRASRPLALDTPRAPPVLREPPVLRAPPVLREPEPEPEPEPGRVRSQAERDLLKALRMAR
jgi:hypothetical protein